MKNLPDRYGVPVGGLGEILHWKPGAGVTIYETVRMADGSWPPARASLLRVNLVRVAQWSLSMKRIDVIRSALVFCLVLAVSTYTEAQSNEAGIFVSTSRIPLSAQVTDSDSGISADLDLEESIGAGVTYSRFWTEHIATELAIQQADSTVRARIDAGGLRATAGVGTLKVVALTALLQWHMRRESVVSPWIGAGFAGLDGDLHVPRQIAELAELEDTELDPVASWLVGAGVSFRISERVRLAVDAKYTRYKPDDPTPVIQDGEAIHPLLLGAGLRFRF